jgi:hypothetical protein
MRFELMELFGEKLIIEFEEASSIPNSPSGKPQLIVHQNN